MTICATSAGRLVAPRLARDDSRRTATYASTSWSSRSSSPARQPTPCSSAASSRDADAVLALRRASENLRPGDRVLLIEDTFDTDALSTTAKPTCSVSPRTVRIAHPGRARRRDRRCRLARAAAPSGGAHPSTSSSALTRLTPTPNATQREADIHDHHPFPAAASRGPHRRALSTALDHCRRHQCECGVSVVPRADTTGETRPFEVENGIIEIPVNPQRIVTIATRRCRSSTSAACPSASPRSVAPSST